MTHATTVRGVLRKKLKRQAKDDAVALWNINHLLSEIENPRDMSLKKTTEHSRTCN